MAKHQRTRYFLFRTYDKANETAQARDDAKCAFGVAIFFALFGLAAAGYLICEKWLGCIPSHEALGAMLSGACGSLFTLAAVAAALSAYFQQAAALQHARSASEVADRDRFFYGITSLVIESMQKAYAASRDPLTDSPNWAEVGPNPQEVAHVFTKAYGSLADRFPLYGIAFAQLNAAIQFATGYPDSQADTRTIFLKGILPPQFRVGFALFLLAIKEKEFETKDDLLVRFDSLEKITFWYDTGQFLVTVGYPRGDDKAEEQNSATRDNFLKNVRQHLI